MHRHFSLTPKSVHTYLDNWMQTHNTVKEFNSAPWKMFHTFLLSADFFSKSTFLENSFRNTIRVSNRLDPDHFFGPDPGPNCLQRLSAEGTRR